MTYTRSIITPHYGFCIKSSINTVKCVIYDKQKQGGCFDVVNEMKGVKSSRVQPSIICHYFSQATSPSWLNAGMSQKNVLLLLTSVFQRQNKHAWLLSATLSTSHLRSLALSLVILLDNSKLTSFFHFYNFRFKLESGKTNSYCLSD